jgi:hypothetical protein
MAEDLVVEVLEGKHSRFIPGGIKETFEELFEEAGIKKGFFKIMLGKQIRGNCETNDVIVHNLNKRTGMILMKVKFNGKKDQRFEAFLTLPNQFRQKPEVFLKALKRGAKSLNNPPIISALTSVNEKYSEIQDDQKSVNVCEKTIRKKPRGIGFDHLISDEEAIYLFWLEVRDMFEETEGIKTLRRKKLIDNFLIQFGHEISCYQVIKKLVDKGVFSEISQMGRKDLLVGERLWEIIIKAEEEQTKKEQLDQKPSGRYDEKIKKLQSLAEEKAKIEALISEKEKQLEELRKELEELSGKITPEMQEAEKNLEILRKILG